MLPSMKHALRHGLLTVTLLLLSACAPGLGNKIEVATLPEIMNTKADEQWKTVRVNIRKFTDVRTRSSSVMINDRMVDVEGDLGAVVQSGFEEGIKGAGGALCLFDCVAIVGDIVRWDMQVKPHFPASKVEAQATLKLSVLTKDGTTPFHGTYSGKMMGEHPYYTEDRLLDAFGTAMNEAIQSALSDPRLVDELNKNSSY